MQFTSHTLKTDFSQFNTWWRPDRLNIHHTVPVASVVLILHNQELVLGTTIPWDKITNKRVNLTADLTHSSCLQLCQPEPLMYIHDIINYYHHSLKQSADSSMNFRVIISLHPVHKIKFLSPDIYKLCLSSYKFLLSVFYNASPILRNVLPHLTSYTSTISSLSALPFPGPD